MKQDRMNEKESKTRVTKNNSSCWFGMTVRVAMACSKKGNKTNRFTSRCMAKKFNVVKTSSNQPHRQPHPTEQPSSNQINSYL